MPEEPGNARTRTIAFDNVYGHVATLRLYVAVDGGPEQTHTAACDQKACTFSIPLTDGGHTLRISVEQDGKRSQAATVAIDAAAAGSER